MKCLLAEFLIIFNDANLLLMQVVLCSSILSHQCLKRQLTLNGVQTEI